MLRSLVGSEMCIRDSINAEYGDPSPVLMVSPTESMRQGSSSPEPHVQKTKKREREEASLEANPAKRPSTTFQPPCQTQLARHADPGTVRIRHFSSKAVLIQRAPGSDALPSKEQLRKLRANWNGRIGEAKGGGGFVLQRHRQVEFENLMEELGIPCQWPDPKAQPLN
eukprot:TRINITY_DN2974_c0_g1_i1.p1 TRINITY_DN2974_c0_g1~~TRINITY_DN2974_c0_g1_i1.p1  ORF type:complete len:168 (-),score=36.68 TRINITY_DN2974_c0_g1_i1:408-911(-)